jgi:HD-GYP domain-containing protein (c-di-GMP phosphodiesterase class II)
LAQKSFFSISYDLVLLGKDLPYDLFINSSSLADKQKFIRLFKKGNTLDEEQVNQYREKFPQLYVAEEERSLYLKSLIQSESIDDVETTNFIKESAIKYLHQIFDDEKEFSTELLTETIKGCRDAVEGMIDVLDDYNIDSLRGLIGNLSSHDFYTYDHSINVSMYCIQILRALKPNASKDELTHAGLGGLLHDLGKVKIPTHILNSPGGLTDEEYQVIKTHPGLGLELLLENQSDIGEDIDVEIIGKVVNQHHENWNGTGYPSQLKENEIHILARICTIADFFDAITTKRSYNEVLTISQAMEVMEKFSGVKLDPKIFAIFSGHITHSKVESTKELKLSDSFDPTLPYDSLPLEEIYKMFEKEDFGKIKFLDDDKKEEKDKK